MKYKSQTEVKAHEYAACNDYKLRYMPYSIAYPNGYIRVKAPTGQTFIVTEWHAVIPAIFEHKATISGGVRQ
ncbi:hypothetical protein [Marinicrinis sediminis]|uniref:Uncharacterized protein n=1 Tax=Marinicrinis sediminis TaxID=1652465 RepID=A0ABW5RCP2_9BACL